MRVLVASKFWYPRGGLERVMLDEVAALERGGHHVAAFATAHPETLETPWNDYFVPYIELGAAGSVTRAQKAQAAARMFWNAEAARRFERLVTDFAPDVIHIHGIHRQLSPSILDVARRANVPVVQTLHDYHHVCPADVLLQGGRTPCSSGCGRMDYSAAVRHRCVRGSLAASFLSASETGFQRLRGAYDRGVDLFISPSGFLAERMAAGGWRVPTTVIPNAVGVRSPRENATRSGLFYAGRLSPEKGIGVAIEAATRVGASITIAGDGPMRAELEADYPEAEFLGYLSASQLAERLDTAVAAVIPSVWYENAPMAVLEAMAAGVPVIATDIGGIPEIVRDQTDGFLVQPGDVDEMASAMKLLTSDPELADNMGRAAQGRVRDTFSPEQHTARLLDAYERVIAVRRSA